MFDILRTPTGEFNLVPLKKKIPEKNSGGETCFFLWQLLEVELSNVTEHFFFMYHVLFAV